MDPSSSSSSDESSLFSGEDSSAATSTTSSPSMSSGSSDETPDTMVKISAEKKCVGRNDRLKWGVTSVIGRRPEMEDAVSVVPGFVTDTCKGVGGCTARSSSEVGPVHFFGVFDGHGGSEVADFCAARMHGVIADELNREEMDGSKWQKKWEEAFTSGFKKVDDQVVSEANASEMVGSTAIVAVVSGCQIILSNCGDSRAVLCRRTQTIPLTVDHKPDREDELLRIEAAGGKVINWHGARVLGVLAMSRAIGDRYMSPFVIPVPEISFMTRSEEDECLILASDGLWDVISNEEVGEVARCLLRRKRRSMTSSDVSPAQVVADNLRELAMRRNSSDNISIIVVDLKSRRRQQGRQ